MSERDMNDDVPEMGAFDEEQGMEDVEFVEAPQGYKVGEAKEEDKGEKIVLTPEEYEALKNGGDTSKAIISGLKELASGLGGGGAVNMPQQLEGESDDAFAKRLEAELLEEGKGAKVIGEAVDRKLGKSMGLLIDEMREQNRRLIKLDPETKPILDRWGGEIEKVVKGLPAAQQRNPRVWEYAVGEVKKRHAGELEEEVIDAKVAEKVKATLVELGIDVSKLDDKKKGGAPGRKPVFGGGSGVARGGSANVGGGDRKKVMYTKEEAALAARMGMNIKDYLKTEGRI